MRAALAFVACCLAPAAGAQSVSLDELTAKLDARSDELSGFRRLLADPDPDRALGAMTLIMETGDPVLINLALEAGLTSAQPVMRKTALDAFIATRPTLFARAELKDDEEARLDHFKKFVERAGGSLASETTAIIPLPTGPWDAEKRCFVIDEGEDAPCHARIGGDGVAYLLAAGRGGYEAWAGFELGEDGRLIGSASAQYSGGPVTLTVDLLGGGE